MDTHDDLSDIDPVIVETVLEHADAFIDADAKVDEIVAWGERELAAREAEIMKSGGSLDDFKAAAAEIEKSVADKLQALEAEITANAAPAAVVE